MIRIFICSSPVRQWSLGYPAAWGPVITFRYEKPFSFNFMMSTTENNNTRARPVALSAVVRPAAFSAENPGIDYSKSRSRSAHLVVAKTKKSNCPEIDLTSESPITNNNDFVMQDLSDNCSVPKFASKKSRSDRDIVSKPRAPSAVKRQRLIESKRLLQVAAWNVNTLSDTKHGRGEILADDLHKYKIDIGGLSEVRIPGSGSKQLRSSSGSTYDIFYCGHDKDRVRGVGLVVSTFAKRALASVNNISDRLMSARFHQSNQYISVVVGYAPTESGDSGEKDRFYVALNDALSAIDKQDFLILLGDFNSGVGSQRTGWEKILGPHTASGPRNDNGSRLLRLCSDQNLRLMNTFFEKKPGHMVTWTSNAGNCSKTIDYIATRARHFSSFQNVRVYPQTALLTDHHLLVAAIKLKLRKAPHVPKSKKFAVLKLQDQDTRLSFCNRANELLGDTAAYAEKDVEKIWEHVSSALSKAGAEKVGSKKFRPADRFAGATTNAIIADLQKPCTKIERRRLIQQLRRSSRRDEVAYWTDMTAILQRAFDTGDAKALFGTLKKIMGGPAAVSETLLNEDGSLLSDKEACMGRWKDHFATQLNKEKPTSVDPSLCVEAAAATPDERISTEPPSEAEVEKVLKGLKDGKAPGLDGLPPEFFKTATGVLTPWITLVLRKVWLRGRAPVDWQICGLAPVFKKGDRRCPKNYRGIALLPIVCKVMSIIVLHRIVDVLDEKISESQAGFRSDRGTIEQILLLRQVLERRAEHRKETVVAFLDFSCAFDSIDRTALWQLLLIAGVPKLYVDMIQSMYEATLCRVKAYGRLSDAFAVGTGVRQGDVLSPLLFLLAIQYVIGLIVKEEDGVDFATNHRVASAEYADDVALLGSSVQELQDLLDRFQKAAEVMGLSLNVGKCKMIAHPPTDDRLTVGGSQMDTVDSFPYLGSQITANGDPGPEIDARIGRATGAFKSLHKKLWGRKGIPAVIKFKFYKASVLSTLLYGLNTVAIRNGDKLTNWRNSIAVI